MSKFKVMPANGGSSYEVEGDRMEYETSSGRHLIFQGNDVAASIINATVVKVPDSAPAQPQS